MFLGALEFLWSMYVEFQSICSIKFYRPKVGNYSHDKKRYMLVLGLIIISIYKGNGGTLGKNINQGVPKLFTE